MLSSPTGSGIPPDIPFSEELSPCATTAPFAATMPRETGSVSTPGTCFLTLPGFAMTSGHGSKRLSSWHSLKKTVWKNWLVWQEADGTRFGDGMAFTHDQIVRDELCVGVAVDSKNHGFCRKKMRW